MRILLMGGTRYVGRHVVEAALARGHDVTVFHRGRTGADLFPGVEHRFGDRDADLSALTCDDAGSWDATVDACGYLPRQVRDLGSVLTRRTGRYLFVSSTSAYSASRGFGHDEDAPMAELADPATEEITDETYGGLKAACEVAAREVWGDRLTVVRPTYVVGPHDYTHRFTYWVERLARGGEVLAPEPRSSGIQLIDARDLGDWCVRLLEDDVEGCFHAVSPEPGYTMGSLLEDLADAVGPPSTRLTWVDRQFLLDAGVTGGELPLWVADDDSGVEETADPSRAKAAGLRARPVAQTARELVAAERDVPTANPDGTGMAAEREAQLLAAWHSA